MSTTNQYDWVDFYKELASKLLLYKNDRKELVDKVLKIYEIKSAESSLKDFKQLSFEAWRYSEEVKQAQVVFA